jgi:cell division protein FtsW
MEKGKVDRIFLIISATLVLLGFFIFSSASLGLLASNGTKFSSVAFNQLFLGLFLGSLACMAFMRIDYNIFRKYALPLFVSSIILTLLVFAPVIGFEHGGAKRWLDFGFISFQPSEFLKIGFIIYLAAWISKAKEKIQTLESGLIPFIIMLGIVGAVLLAQPDTDTYLVIVVAGVAMYLTGGGRWSHILIVGLIGLLGLVVVAFARPYIMQRITTFFNPNENTLTSGYQIRQSLIAVGSGGIGGRGFGKSIQKFNYLPEPIGDSIFAVAAEEFGFIGSCLILFIFILFGTRGLRIASESKDTFGGLLVVGIVIIIMCQMFVNIGGMIAVLPLTGIPLPFISHGGTALLITLVETGIILNVSNKNTRIKKI